MISSLARKFGERIIFENRDLCTFPKPEALAQASLSELKGCGVGYRAKYIMKSAEMISNRKIDLHLLKRFDYKPAKKKLLSIPGVGQKVADCVLLFSLDKLEAFPVDVWVKRVMLEWYGRYLAGVKVRNEYEEINFFGRRYFGRYAGYAQEYLFYYRRVER
jgi:N-glycosylase/DNA lyase